MAADLYMLTAQENAEPFSTVCMYFRASNVMAYAERREERARSEAKRAYWRAERMRAHAVLLHCLELFRQPCPERDARVARAVERALAEQRAAALEPAPVAA